LRILNLEDRSTRVLTTEYDNLPGWSPDGSRILFTRRVDEVNFDIFTIKPDGSDLLRLPRTGQPTVTRSGPQMEESCGIAGFTVSATRRRSKTTLSSSTGGSSS
jgi:Tol biopolymer transport system component